MEESNTPNSCLRPGTAFARMSQFGIIRSLNRDLAECRRIFSFFS